MTDLARVRGEMRDSYQRTEAARARRVDAFLRAHRRKQRSFGRRHLVMQCECCPKFSRMDLMSKRGWCQECEKEFRQVRLAMAQQGLPL